MGEQKKAKPQAEPKAEIPAAPEIADDDPRLGQPPGKLNGEKAPATVQSAPVVPEQRKVVGARLPPQALQMAVNVLKVQPWEDVADFMPTLIQAQPIFEDELHEYQRQLAESE